MFKIKNQFKSIFIFILIFTLLGFFIANYSVNKVTTSYESVLDHSLPIMNKSSKLAQLSSQLESELIQLHFDTIKTLDNEKLKLKRIEKLSFLWIDIKDLLDEFLVYNITEKKQIKQRKHEINEYLKFTPEILDEINFLIQSKNKEFIFNETIETIINYNDKILLAEIESFWKDQLINISSKEYDEEVEYSSRFYRNSTQLLSYFRQVFLTKDISKLNKLKRDTVTLYKEMKKSGSYHYEYKLFANEFLEKVKPIYSGKNSLFRVRHDILRLTNIIDSLIQQEIDTTKEIKKISVLIQNKVQNSLFEQKTKIKKELYRANQYLIVLLLSIFLIVLFSIWFLVNKSLISRITDIRLKVLELSKGNTNIDLKVYKKDEIGDIEESLFDLKGYVEKAKKLSTSDSLTGLLNTAQFHKNLEVEVRRCSRQDQVLSLTIIDIDYFKKYNDTYGHPEGDKCIKKIADLISKTCQRAGESAYRIGGEEFAIIMPHISAKEQYLKMKELQEKLCEYKILHKSSDVSSFVTISIGIYSSNILKTSSFEKLYKNADKALYEAKKTRNTIIVKENIY